MVRQDAGVQHVGIGEDQVALFADGFARVAGRVAVVGEDAEAVVEARVEVVQFGELVLREGFGREKIDGAGVGIFEDRVQDRQVVAERFAGGRRRDDDDVFSGVDGFGGSGLVGVGLVDFFGLVGGLEVGMQPRGEVGVLGFSGGEVAHGGEDFAARVAFGEGFEHLADAGERGRLQSSADS